MNKYSFDQLANIQNRENQTVGLGYNNNIDTDINLAANNLNTFGNIDTWIAAPPDETDIIQGLDRVIQQRVVDATANPFLDLEAIQFLTFKRLLALKITPLIALIQAEPDYAKKQEAKKKLLEVIRGISRRYVLRKGAGLVINPAIYFIGESFKELIEANVIKKSDLKVIFQEVEPKVQRNFLRRMRESDKESLGEFEKFIEILNSYIDQERNVINRAKQYKGESKNEIDSTNFEAEMSTLDKLVTETREYTKQTDIYGGNIIQQVNQRGGQIITQLLDSRVVNLATFNAGKKIVDGAVKLNVLSRGNRWTRGLIHNQKAVNLTGRQSSKLLIGAGVDAVNVVARGGGMLLTSALGAQGITTATLVAGAEIMAVDAAFVNVIDKLANQINITSYRTANQRIATRLLSGQPGNLLFGNAKLNIKELPIFAQQIDDCYNLLDENPPNPNNYLNKIPTNAKNIPTIINELYKLIDMLAIGGDRTITDQIKYIFRIKNYLPFLREEAAKDLRKMGTPGKLQTQVRRAEALSELLDKIIIECYTARTNSFNDFLTELQKTPIDYVKVQLYLQEANKHNLMLGFFQDGAKEANLRSFATDVQAFTDLVSGVAGGALTGVAGTSLGEAGRAVGSLAA